MKLSYVMDTLFDLINESDNLDVQDLQIDVRTGKLCAISGDGTKITLQCAVTEGAHPD